MSVEDPLRMNRFPLRSLAVALMLASGSLAAAPLDAALDESQRLAAEAKASQGRIEQLDDASREMLTEYQLFETIRNDELIHRNRTIRELEARGH